jgi:hypothetical protein
MSENMETRRGFERLGRQLRVGSERSRTEDIGLEKGILLESERSSGRWVQWRCSDVKSRRLRVTLLPVRLLDAGQHIPAI